MHLSFFEEEIKLMSVCQTYAPFLHKREHVTHVHIIHICDRMRMREKDDKQEMREREGEVLLQ